MVRKFVLALLYFLLFIPEYAYAQVGYEDELYGISGDLRTIMQEYEYYSGQGGYTAQRGNDALEALLSLSKRLHRIEEEAIRTNMSLARSGRGNQYNLIATAAAARELDVQRQFIVNYILIKSDLFRADAEVSARLAREILSTLR